jgi:Tetratricopeptide repeat
VSTASALERNVTSGNELFDSRLGFNRMPTTEQINSFWKLARERSVDGEVLRRRIAATGAITIGFCGFLLAIGLGVVVLVFVAGIVASVGIAMLLALWPRLRSFGGGAMAYVRDRSRRARGRLVPLWRRGLGAARMALVEAGAHTSNLARAAAAPGSRVGRGVGRTARATMIRFARRAARVNPEREAIRLNADGTRCRRSGRYSEAVECHRHALEVLRALGDRRGVALTQSNLALALSHAGDDDWAVALFEEAAATLAELGDEEHEAQIMANLGVTHRRRGRRDEGDNVLELALSKLSPASSSYEAIAAELRRAG